MRVLLAGGGSGGSATPVLAVGEELRQRDPLIEVLYLGTMNGPERALVEASGFHFEGIPAGKLRRYFSLSNIWDIGTTTAGITRSLQLVRGFRPQVAFGAGGFASVPPLWAARMLGVPVQIHQQDVVPGLANKLLIPAAQRISVAFDATRDAFPAFKTAVRGNPVRHSIMEGDARRFLHQFGFSEEVPVILVTGGGTGALGLNRLVAEAMPALVEHAQILHLTGTGRSVPVNVTSSRYAQREFVTDDMKDALAAATLIITRAGLGTLTEIGALAKAAIIIPMPGSHQVPNARAFASKGAGLYREEASLTASSFIDDVLALLQDPERRIAMGSAARSLVNVNAARAIADDLIEIARGS